MTDASPGTLTYQEFFSLYYKKIVAYLTNRCASKQDAEDIASESFFYCAQHWSDYDPQKASYSSWVYMVARSRWKNYCRDHRDNDNIDDYERILPANVNDMERAVWITEVRQELAQALTGLSDNQRQAIILRYWGGKDDQEIAAVLGLSVGNVRVLIHRGIHKLEDVCGNRLKDGMSI